MDKQINEDLLCPITLELLEDPVIPSCCGRAISRQALITCLQNSSLCPMCHTDISHINPMDLPKAVNLAYLVEKEKNKQEPVELFCPPKVNSKWKAVVHKLCNNDGVFHTVIGQLNIINNDNSFKFKTLLIPVIDESGSMSGNPTEQVKYSLNRIVDMTFKYSQVMTHVIGYSDNVIQFAIDKTNPIDSYRAHIARIGRGGGTSFRSAFNGITDVCKKYLTNQDITSIVIIFLTDGEDSSVGKDKRSELVSALKTDLEKVWSKPYIVHTVGFASSHDFDFLNGLRQIGTSEGAYRYADPNEDSDSLSNKINSLLDVIVTSSTVPIKLVTHDEIPLISGENGKYWINLTNCNPNKNYDFQISINNGEPITIPMEFAEDENDSTVQNEWYSYLIDEIASELLMLSNQSNDIVKELHLELLQQRCRSIGVRLDDTSSSAVRLAKLVETIKDVQKGNQIDKFKMNDMKFEGKYATKTSSLPQPVQNTITYPVLQSQLPPTKCIPWRTIPKPSVKRCYSSSTSPEVFQVIGTFNYDNMLRWFQTNLISNYREIDKNGANVLVVASSIGKDKLVKLILNLGCVEFDCKNNLGYNAIDMAVLFGHWRTFDILYEHGLKPSINGDLLLRTCISNSYYQLAQKLVEVGLTVITDDMVDSAPTTEAVTWLSARTQKEMTVETAIVKGIYDTVEEKIKTVKNISWKPYLEILAKPSMDHLRIIDLLLKNGVANADEIIDTKIPNNNGEVEDEITWPLFVACEKGNLSLFKMLIKYLPIESINRQNKKGTTILWIACCNRHIDIVTELLTIGADPNIPNLKGDGPLIPSCQKGNDMIVSLLLEAGAKLNVFNKNRDNPVLICCRTGQAKILEMLLRTMNKSASDEIFNSYADIDGFNPLLAATELEKIECIKVCIKYGANLEARSGEDNKIIAGATALHLACFYGRLEAVKTLLALGIDAVSKTTVTGHTALHIAIKQGHTNVTRYLLSVPKCRECLNIFDYDGRLPVYYANLNGNEEILQEFFTNKLAGLLDKVILADNETEKKCSDILVKYGRSLGVYGYENITNIDMGKGSVLLSNALVTGNHELVQALIKMGANINKPDDYGTTPSFWASYLGCTDIPPDDRTIEMLDRVKTIGKRSIQNKMLLGLQNNKPLLLTAPDQISTLAKMNHGFGSNVNPKVLAILKSSQMLDHSLLEFIDKLKNNKIFPNKKNNQPSGTIVANEKQSLEYIIWDSKIHLIKLVAAGETLLQPVHILALYLYTSNWKIFEQVNLSITDWKDNGIWNPFIYCLYQGINLIPPYIGEVYRPVDYRFSIQNYTIGTKIVWSAFSIASLEWRNCNDLINKKRGIVFIIQSLTGRNISRYSKYPVDSEVIFLPGTEFIVVDHYIASIITLGQANIRKSTYAAKEKDLLRAENGESCIIVELREISTNNLIENKN